MGDDTKPSEVNLKISIGGKRLILMLVQVPLDYCVQSEQQGQAICNLKASILCEGVHTNSD